MAICSEEDDRSSHGFWVGTHLLKDLDAIHDRHLDIKHDQTRLLLVNASKRLGAKVTGYCSKPFIVEDFTKDLNNVRLIIDDNNLVLLMHTADSKTEIEHLAREKTQGASLRPS